MLNSPPMFRQVPLRGLGRRTLGAFPDFDLPDFQMPDLDLSPAPAPALPPADGGAPAPAAPPPRCPSRPRSSPGTSFPCRNNPRPRPRSRNRPLPPRAKAG